MSETPEPTGEQIASGLFSAGLIVGPGFHMGDLLTEQERAVTRMAGDLWNALCEVIGRDRTREADCAELIVHIHAIQHAVMAQAAARAYPDAYRLLGQTLDVEKGETPPVDPEAIREYWTTGAGSEPRTDPEPMPEDSTPEDVVEDSTPEDVVDDITEMFRGVLNWLRGLNRGER